MIPKFVSRFEENKKLLKKSFRESKPSQYLTMVTEVIKVITSQEEYNDYNPDPDRVHQIDDGDYQGTLVFVIGAKGYQPNKYWYVSVYYGSCGGCDTLAAINDYPSIKEKEQIKDYMTLALHIVQGLKVM